MELGPAIAHSGKGEQTMQNLLAAARKLFAERGFRRTSVRDIANEAGSNVAAVNYHFGSKENLYREVFRQHKLSARERGTAAVNEILEESGGNPTVESVLEAFSRASRNARSPSDTRNWMTLIHRELAEPRLDPQFGLKEIIEPLQQNPFTSDIGRLSQPEREVLADVHSLLPCTAIPYGQLAGLLCRLRCQGNSPARLRRSHPPHREIH